MSLSPTSVACDDLRPYKADSETGPARRPSTLADKKRAAT